MTENQKLREAFEAHARSIGWDDGDLSPAHSTRFGDTYKWTQTQQCWNFWQACAKALAMPTAAQAKLKDFDPITYSVIAEMRDEAKERRSSDPTTGISADNDTAEKLEWWANRLESTNTTFLEDVYEQCCNLLDPLVMAGELPSSVVESLQTLVEERKASKKETAAPVDERELLSDAELLDAYNSIDPCDEDRTTHRLILRLRAVASRASLQSVADAKDAERYRWLRDNFLSIQDVGDDDFIYGLVVDGEGLELAAASAEESPLSMDSSVDAAIDAAIARGKGE